MYRGVIHIAIIIIGVLATTITASPCAPNPCLNAGTCTVTSGGSAFTCTCWPGYMGPTCQTQMCYNNAVQPFTANGSLIANTTKLMVFMWGAGGGSNVGDQPALPYPQAGSGAYMQVMLATTVGTQVDVIVATGGGHGWNFSTSGSNCLPIAMGGVPGGGGSGGGGNGGANCPSLGAGEAFSGVGSAGGGFSAISINSIIQVVAAGGGGTGINNQQPIGGSGQTGVIVMGNGGGGGCLMGGNATGSVPGCNITALGGTQTSGGTLLNISSSHCDRSTVYVPLPGGFLYGSNGQGSTNGISSTSGGGGGGGLYGGSGGIGQTDARLSGAILASGAGAGGSSGCLPGTTGCSQVMCEAATVGKAGGILTSQYYLSGVGQGGNGQFIMNGTNGYVVISVCLDGSNTGNGCQCGKSPFPPLPLSGAMSRATIDSCVLLVLLAMSVYLL